MTRVAIHAVIHIPANIRVTETGRVIVPVASRALEYGIVARVSVAGGTHAVGAAVVQREVRVIECRSRPRRCGVARRAGCRKPGSLVVRTRRGGI